jgi:hypothetical protein
VRVAPQDFIHKIREVDKFPGFVGQIIFSVVHGQQEKMECFERQIPGGRLVESALQGGHGHFEVM